MERSDGFGVVLVLGVLAVVGSLGLALGIVLEEDVRGGARAVDRAAAYYLAEGIVERLIAERLAGDGDWSDVPADTLYDAVALDRGTCTAAVTNPAADRVDVLSSARFRDTVATLRLRVRRAGGTIRWERLAEPFAVVREE
jgi:hypothetical protein